VTKRNRVRKTRTENLARIVSTAIAFPRAGETSVASPISPVVARGNDIRRRARSPAPRRAARLSSASRRFSSRVQGPPRMHFRHSHASAAHALRSNAQREGRCSGGVFSSYDKQLHRVPERERVVRFERGSETRPPCTQGALVIITIVTITCTGLLRRGRWSRSPRGGARTAKETTNVPDATV
jgi:hypothetical protein